MYKYELSQEGYEALMKMGDNAKNILAQYSTPIRTTQQESFWQRVKSSLHHIPKDKKERLTSEKMQELFGANYRGIVYYNFDKKVHFSLGYEGALSASAPIAPNNAAECKTVLEHEPLFSDREVVATVVMSIAPQKSGTSMIQGKKIKNPVHAPQGSTVVGTLVTRNCTTGKINPVPTTWLGVCNDGIKYNAGARKAEFFAELLGLNAKYRQAMLELHINQK